MAGGRLSQPSEELRKLPNLLTMFKAFDNEGTNNDVMVLRE
jgi:hypothetical protein